MKNTADTSPLHTTPHDNTMTERRAARMSGRRTRRTASVYAAMIVCVAFAAVHGPVADAQEVIAVNFNLIPTGADTSATTVPRGCTCQSSEASCNEFDCTCVCDLTAGSCDPNCCCDSECSSAEIARFRAADACLEEGPLPTTTQYCADLSNEALFGSINPRFRMVKNEEDSIVDDLMCVAVDNNPSLGTYFENPGTGTTALLDSTTKPPSFQFAARVTSDSSATVYEVGGDVGAALDSSGTLVESGGGTLMVPQPGGNGACFDSNAVHFAEDVSSTSCVRVLSGTSAVRCASLDMANFVTNLRVAKAPNSATSDSTTYVSVTLSSIQYRYLNGTVSAHPDGNYVAAISSGDTCTNALYQVDYTLTEDGNGAVTAAAATVIVGEADMSGTFTTLAQTWSVTWASSASVTTSYASGNLVAREMSGNPGYVAGKPVLAGTRVTDGGDKEAIQAWVNGLGLKQCDGTTLEYVEYGASMTFGCTLTLTAAELEAMCTSKSQLTKFGTDATYVGAFGNADPLHIGEWVQIVTESSSALSTTWVASSRSCSGVATGVNVEFLTAPVGEEDNPQHKIMVAQIKYARDTWTFSSRTSTQTFVIANTITFVPKESTGTEEYVPPPPPVLPELPNDLFYPFTLGFDKDVTSHATGAHRGATTVAAVLATLVVSVVLVMMQ